MREKCASKCCAFFLKGVFMCFRKNAKPFALFAAILVLFAVSCATQAVTSPAPVAETGPRLAGRVGNLTEEQLNLIGRVPAGVLSVPDTAVGSLDYTFPAFLNGIWGQPGNDNFYLNKVEDIGYTIIGWPTFCGWEGPFLAVYYLDDQNPELKGLVFAEFSSHPEWCLTPPDDGTISAFYYQKIDENTYYLLNLAKKLPGPDPDFPGYDYGQPMYETVEDALYELIDQGALDPMLIYWIKYARQ
jgi:hypothetical protein